MIDQGVDEAGKQWRRRQRVTVGGLQSLAQLPAAGQVLLILGSREQMTPKQAERLLAWTRQGGHLLVVAETLWDEDKNSSGDLLLDPLGIQQYMSDELDEDSESEPNADAAKDTDEDDKAAETAPSDEPAAAASPKKDT